MMKQPMTQADLKILCVELQSKGFELEIQTFIDPYNNRRLFKSFSEKQRGVYIWQAPQNNLYVGRSTNLYIRIRSYFLPSVLKRKDQRVIFYFNKHGFDGVLLHILKSRSITSMEQLIDLEQTMLSHLKPNLNTELFARNARYAQSFGHSEESKSKRSQPVMVFNKARTLLYRFKSKQDLFQKMHVNHKTLTQCLQQKKHYLNYFIFKIGIPNIVPIYSNINDFLDLVDTKHSTFKPQFKRSKRIRANNVNKNICKTFVSLRAAAKELNADRKTLRKYLNFCEGKTKRTNTSTLFRKQWAFKTIYA